MLHLVPMCRMYRRVLGRELIVRMNGKNEFKNLNEIISLRNINICKLISVTASAILSSAAIHWIMVIFFVRMSGKRVVPLDRATSHYIHAKRWCWYTGRWTTLWGGSEVCCCCRGRWRGNRVRGETDLRCLFLQIFRHRLTKKILAPVKTEAGIFGRLIHLLAVGSRISVQFDHKLRTLWSRREMFE